MKERRRKNKYWIRYSIVFAILFIGCFFSFKLYNKSFFRSFDGLDQHYLIFVYLGKWLREIFSNIFVKHSFSIPLWDMSIGYGSDIVTTLGAYIMDPFNWISVFVPSRYAEYAFSFTIVLKFYFSGLAYSYYAFYKKNDDLSVLCGAIIYTFSATMYIAFVQSFFINPMYIFPFVMLGVEKIWNKENPFIYVFSLAISFINYFYFAYMMCIFIFLYCAYKYMTGKEIEKKLYTLSKWIGIFLTYSILALALAAFIILPIVNVLLGAERLSLTHDIPLFYDWNYYGGLLSGFITSFWMGSTDCILGFGSIALLCVILLFREKGNFGVKLGFLTMTLALCIPYIGHVLNGFSYVTNRWIWAYCLCVAYIVTLMIPQIKWISDKKFLYLQSIVVLYTLILVLVFKQRNFELFFSVLFVLICSIVLYGIRYYSKIRYEGTIIFMTMCSVIIPSYFYFNTNYKNGTSNNVESGAAYDLVMNGGALPLLKKIEAKPSQRYDEYGIRRVRNASWLYGIGGMDLYISLYNNNIDQFHNQMALLTSPWQFEYSGLNRRAELELLAGVEYYLIPEGKTSYLPYSYDILVDKMQIGQDYFEVYTSKHVLPLVYGYNSAIGNDKYNQYNPFEKQQILSQACVIDENAVKNISQEVTVLNSGISYYCENTDGISFDNGKVVADHDKAKIVLKFDEISNSELYVYLKNLHYQRGRISNYSISIQAGYNGEVVEGIGSTVNGLTNTSHMYGGKHDWLVNTGFVRELVNELYITFNKAGEYSLNDLVLYERTADDIEKSIKKINRIADNVKISDNTIHAEVKLNKEEYVYFSVPYSTGWKASVNGEIQPILKANDAFMAIYLPQGVHEIVLSYQTPFLKLGVVISSIAMILCIFGMIKRKRNRTDEGIY